MPVTDFQEVRLFTINPSCQLTIKRVYTYLQLVPAGKVTTYAALARALSSSPRAVGGALRVNPFAPEVPCHRVIASDGYVGGFKGDWQKAPSGVNQTEKLRLLCEEGVTFTDQGKLVEMNGIWFDGPWLLKGRGK